MRIGLAHSFWDVTPRVQNPPDIDVIVAFNVEHQIGIACQGP